MQLSLLSTALALLPAVVSAAMLCPDFKATRCNITALKPAPAGYTCSTKGRVTKPVVLQSACTSTLQQCQSQCISTPACFAFGFNGTGAGQCTLYKELVKNMGFVIDNKSKASFSNRNCFSSSACPPPPQVVPACASYFLVKATGLDTATSQYLTPLYNDNGDLKAETFREPWAFTLDNTTSQLVAAQRCFDTDDLRQTGCFSATAPGYPAFVYTDGSDGNPPRLSLDAPINSANTAPRRNVTCAFTGADGKTLKCTAGTGYTQFSTCSLQDLTVSHPAYLGQSAASGCAPFTMQVVCPVPDTCNQNGFYLQTQGARAGTAGGKWVQDTATTATANGTLQVSSSITARSLFKLGEMSPRSGYANLLDANTGGYAVVLKAPANSGGADPGYAAINTIPSSITTPPDGYGLFRCRINGEELECREDSHGFDVAVVNQTVLAIGKQQSSAGPEVGLKIVCK